MITTKRRHCQQDIEMMQEDVRFQRLLLTRAPQMATQIQRNLEVLKIEIATELLKMRIMLRKIREKEKFQRGYLLLHPREATRIQGNIKHASLKAARKQRNAEGQAGPCKSALPSAKVLSTSVIKFC